MVLLASGEDVWLTTDERVAYNIVEGSFATRMTYGETIEVLSSLYPTYSNYSEIEVFSVEKERGIFLCLKERKRFSFLVLLDKKFQTNRRISGQVSDYFCYISDSICEVEKTLSALKDPIQLCGSRIAYQSSAKAGC